MKTGTMACMAGVAVPLILCRPTRGAYVCHDVVFLDAAEQFGLTTINVYAIFDRPGEDQLLSVFGTPSNPLLVEPAGGTFFQHSLGSARPPSQAFVNLFPALAYDSFVTIGVRTSGDNPQGGGVNVPDELVLSPTFPGDIFGNQS